VSFDWLIRGGEVLDGTGAPPVRADVAVAGDRVVAVAPGLAGADEQARLEALLAAALDEGTFGFSTGLIYAPSVYAETAARGLQYPHVPVGSDNLGLCSGPEEAHPGKPHPRQHGCFAKILGTYVRERGSLTWARPSTR